MNARTKGVVLYAIAAIAIAASGNALAHSYAGLYGWAAHHRLTGWQAMSWPAEIDVFLAVGELALYVAYLDGWPVRQRVWAWITALIGLAVSVAGNVGHIRPLPDQPVGLTDRLTAATSPLAAFAGLTVGLLVLRMNRQRKPAAAAGSTAAAPVHVLGGAAAGSNGHRGLTGARGGVPGGAAVQDQILPSAVNGARLPRGPGDADPDPAVVRAASALLRLAAERGERVSQRALARRLRGNGHRFANQHLRLIATAARPGPSQQFQHPAGDGPR